MADVVYLHVGAPKTGTTYIQDRLALNRSTLSRHGIRYPIGVRGDMFLPALDLVELPWGGMLAEAKGEWEGLVRRTHRAKGTVVISQEILGAAKPQRIEMAMADLAPADVHIVFTARDLARQVPAEWQERLKHRRRMGYRKFVRRIQDPKSRATWGSFWRVQGLPQILERWGRNLLPDHIHVVTVPQPGAAPGELWRRFCAAVGIDPAWAPLDNVRRNQSIGVAQSAMLRRLNRRLADREFGEADYHELVRQIIVQDTLSAVPEADRLTLPPWAYDWAEETTESWIEWIEGSGIDVIGDLEDLRPVRPAPDAVWSNPDKPAAADVTSAALDSLVAVMEEAAGRRNPDAQLPARVSRVVSRLRDR